MHSLISSPLNVVNFPQVVHVIFGLVALLMNFENFDRGCPKKDLKSQCFEGFQGHDLLNRASLIRYPYAKSYPLQIIITITISISICIYR